MRRMRNEMPGAGGPCISTRKLHGLAEEVGQGLPKAAEGARRSWNRTGPRPQRSSRRQPVVVATSTRRRTSGLLVQVDQDLSDVVRLGGRPARGRSEGAVARTVGEWSIHPQARPGAAQRKRRRDICGSCCRPVPSSREGRRTGRCLRPRACSARSSPGRIRCRYLIRLRLPSRDWGSGPGDRGAPASARSGNTRSLSCSETRRWRPLDDPSEPLIDGRYPSVVTFWDLSRIGPRGSPVTSQK